MHKWLMHSICDHQPSIQTNKMLHSIRTVCVCITQVSKYISLPSKDGKETPEPMARTEASRLRPSNVTPRDKWTLATKHRDCKRLPWMCISVSAVNSNHPGRQCPSQQKELECGPMPNVIVALPNIGQQSCAMVPKWRFFASCISSEPRVAHFRRAF